MSLKPRRGFLRPPPIGNLAGSDTYARNKEAELSHSEGSSPEENIFEPLPSFHQQQQSLLKKEFDKELEEAPELDPRWAFPDYTDTSHQFEPTAMNYSPRSIHPAPVEEDIPEAPPLLTEDEIAQIKADAYKEGFEQGREEGLTIGLEEGKAQGVEQGIEEGKAMGYNQGFNSGQDAIEEQMTQLSTLLEQFVTPLQQVDQQVEQLMLTMVTTLAKELIDIEFKTNPNALIYTLQHAIQALPEKEQSIKVYLQPEDLTLVKQFYDEESLNAHRWQLLSDPMLTKGSVRLESGHSTVESDLQQRIKDLFSNFQLSNQQHTKDYQPDPVSIHPPHFEKTVIETPEQLETVESIEIATNDPLNANENSVNSQTEETTLASSTSLSSNTPASEDPSSTPVFIDLNEEQFNEQPR